MKNSLRLGAAVAAAALVGLSSDTAKSIDVNEAGPLGSISHSVSGDIKGLVGLAYMNRYRYRSKWLPGFKSKISS